MMDSAAPSLVRAKFHLGKAWKLKGEPEAALRIYREVLALDSGFVPARISLADVLLERGEVREALKQYDEALRLEPANSRLEFRRRYLGKVIDRAEADRLAQDLACRPANNPAGRIRFDDRKRFSCHRGGWELGMQSLEALHNDQGVLFDSFLENNFAWRHRHEGVREPNVLKRLMLEGGFDELASSEEKGITPYTEPWVGFIHNPHNMPAWFHHQESPQAIFAKQIWKRSREYCRGLFCLSRYQADWLRRETGLPVSVLTLPAEIPERQFSMEAFLANSRRLILQVGWWLRRMNSINRLPVGRGNRLRYQKVRLVPRFFGDADRYLRELMERERAETGISVLVDFVGDTREIQHLPDDEYDSLLAENVVFIDLLDSGANHTVVECIARATPLLVNPLPAVVEYLGESYPLYFGDLQDAASKVQDLARVEAAHHYLRDCPTRRRLAPGYFRRTFEESEVYTSLPTVG